MDGKRAAVALLLTLVVSCGGATPTSNTGAGTSAAATSAATQAAAATAAVTASATASAQSLSALLAAGKVKEYKITYKIAATGGGAEALSGDQTWYFKPPRSRFDFSTNMGGQSTTMSIFTLPEGSFMCFAAAGQSQCLGTPATGSPLDANQAILTQRAMVENPGQYGATFTGAKTIAGQQGQCYDVAATAGAFSKGAFCYTKEGIQLSSAFAVQGSTWSMEATNLSTTVPDSDFTLPSKPVN